MSHRRRRYDMHRTIRLASAVATVAPATHVGLYGYTGRVEQVRTWVSDGLANGDLTDVTIVRLPRRFSRVRYATYFGQRLS